MEHECVLNVGSHKQLNAVRGDKVIRQTRLIEYTHECQPRQAWGRNWNSDTLHVYTWWNMCSICGSHMMSKQPGEY